MLISWQLHYKMVFAPIAFYNFLQDIEFWQNNESKIRKHAFSGGLFNSVHMTWTIQSMKSGPRERLLTPMSIHCLTILNHIMMWQFCSWMIPFSSVNVSDPYVFLRKALARQLKTFGCVSWDGVKLKTMLKIPYWGAQPCNFLILGKWNHDFKNQ